MPSSLAHTAPSTSNGSTYRSLLTSAVASGRCIGGCGRPCGLLPCSWRVCLPRTSGTSSRAPATYPRRYELSDHGLCVPSGRSGVRPFLPMKDPQTKTTNLVIATLWLSTSGVCRARSTWSFPMSELRSGDAGWSADRTRYQRLLRSRVPAAVQPSGPYGHAVRRKAGTLDGRAAKFHTPGSRFPERQNQLVQLRNICKRE
jgi:hypothetical protein